MYKFEKSDFSTYKKKCFKNVFTLYNNLNMKYKLDILYKDSLNFYESWRKHFYESGNDLLLIKRKDNLIGYLRIFHGYNNDRTAETAIFISSILDRNDTDLNLETTKIISKYNEENPNEITSIYVYNKEFKEVVCSFKAKHYETINYYILPKKSINVAELKATRDAIVSRFPDYNFKITDGIEGEYLGDYCNLLTTIRNEIYNNIGINTTWFKHHSENQILSNEKYRKRRVHN